MDFKGTLARPFLARIVIWTGWPILNRANAKFGWEVLQKIEGGIFSALGLKHRGCPTSSSTRSTGGFVSVWGLLAVAVVIYVASALQRDRILRFLRLLGLRLTNSRVRDLAGVCFGTAAYWINHSCGCIGTMLPGLQ